MAYVAFNTRVPLLDLSQLRVFPLNERRSLTQADDILIDPQSPPQPVGREFATGVERAAQAIRRARDKNAAVILMYGAHLLRNGAATIVTELMEKGWVTHLATNGAGSIHDWEYAWLGRSTESVEQNVATGTFGTWDETSRYLHMAIMAGALEGLGYGGAVGKFIANDGCDLPDFEATASLIAQFPADPMAAACSELLCAMRKHGWEPGRQVVEHKWKHASIFAQASRLGVPLTVHPGIGYDIISCHPVFNGAAIGRGAAHDFRLFAGSVDQLDDGVVLSVGSAIMAPQVFEKSLSCVHNIRFQQGRGPVAGHSIFIVDLQDGGGWDWTQGEPPKTNAAYYLRFCKSFSRMGGAMHYLQGDNIAFVHHLHRLLTIA
ncbi:MAG TPA: hypothetical protein VMF06_16645 [Candidatus Limnocylindria bacterium]|nr:hypothetical protein [Candidatus Limnocylindria bacterium]